jgi:hypothetical protein
MRGNVDIKACVAERGQVGNRRLRAEQDDEIDIAGKGVTGPNPNQLDRWFGLQRVEIVEVGHMRKNWDRDLDPCLCLYGRRPVERQSVFCRK